MMKMMNKLLLRYCLYTQEKVASSSLAAFFCFSGYCEAHLTDFKAKKENLRNRKPLLRILLVDDNTGVTRGIEQ